MNPLLWPRWAQGVALLVAAIVIFVAWDAYDDWRVVKDHEAKREAKAAPAREKAADKRIEDDRANRELEEEYRDAIDKAPGGELSPAARALACERLRRVGRVPPACRSESGDGGETPPR